MELKHYERKYEIDENDTVQRVITKGKLAAMCDRCKRITYIDINVQYEHIWENECDETYHKITCKHCKNIYMVKTVDLLDANIAEIISIFNRCGIQTDCSCEGNLDYMYPYIKFKNNKILNYINIIPIPDYWYINEDRYFYRNSKNNKSIITLEYDYNNCVCYDLEKEIEKLYKFAIEISDAINKENLNNIINEGGNNNGS